MNKLILTFLTLLLGLGVNIIVEASQGLDPTKPLSGTATSLSEVKQIKKHFILESIIHGINVHTAVINGKTMMVNDYIGGYRLVAVNDDSVILRSSEERVKLYVFSKEMSIFQLGKDSSPHGHPH